MKKYLKKISLSLLAILFLPIKTSAQILDLADQTARSGGYNTSIGANGTGIAFIVGIVARSFISLIGVIFVSYTIYGGYLWMTAAGSDEKVDKSKKIIRDGIIGLILILSAAGIYWFVTNTLVGPIGANNNPIGAGS